MSSRETTKAPAKSSTGRRRRRSVKADRTKETIKQTIRQIVSEKGYRRLRLSEVYQRAGITSGAFYYHFYSKEQAFEEAAVDLVHDIYQSYAEIEWTDDLFADIRHLVGNISAVYMEKPLIMQALISTLYASQKVFQVFLDERSHLTDLLVARIETARHEAGIINQMERTTAEFLLAATTSFLENVFLSRYPDLRGLRENPLDTQLRISVFWFELIMRKDPLEFSFRPDALLYAEPTAKTSRR